jgi:hypothetical protein
MAELQRDCRPHEPLLSAIQKSGWTALNRENRRQRRSKTKNKKQQKSSMNATQTMSKNFDGCKIQKVRN